MRLNQDSLVVLELAQLKLVHTLLPCIIVPKFQKIIWKDWAQVRPNSDTLIDRVILSLHVSAFDSLFNAFAGLLRELSSSVSNAFCPCFGIHVLVIVFKG